MLPNTTLFLRLFLRCLLDISPYLVRFQQMYIGISLPKNSISRKIMRVKVNTNNYKFIQCYTIFTIKICNSAYNRKFIGTVSREYKRSRKHRADSFPAKREPRVLWERRIVQRAQRDNRGRPFRKFDGMRVQNDVTGEKPDRSFL